MKLNLGLIGKPSFNPYHLSSSFFGLVSYASSALLPNKKGIFPDFVGTGGIDVTDGVITFDGANDYYYNDTSNTATYVKQTQTPDASGSDTGKGFTCTGLSKASDGTWWFSNFGLNKNGSSGQQPSLVQTDADLNLIKEVLLKPIDNTITGLQGLQIERATGYAWIAVADRGRIYVIDTDKESLATNFVVDALPNGIALDEVNQRFFVLYVNGNAEPIVKSYNMSDGSYITTHANFTGLTFGDHIWYDSETNILWVTTGANAYNAGRLYAYSVTKSEISGSVSLAEGDAVEGVYLDFTANKLYVANDAYFHELDINAGGDATLKNSLLEYDFDASFLRSVYSKNYDQLELNMVMDAFSVLATSVIYQIGDPLNTNDGISVYAVNSSTIRIFIGNGTGWESFDFAISPLFSLSSISPVYRHLTVKLDFSNKLISVWQNGVQMGNVQSWSGALTALTYRKAVIAASAVPDRFIGMKMKEFNVADTLLSSRDMNNLGRYWSSKHGLTWSDDLGISSMANIELWLDASDLPTITHTSGAVSTWGDKSGNNNDATQVTVSRQPTTGVTLQNNKNVLDFDGGDSLVLPSALYSIPAGDSTVFVVSVQTSSALDYIISMTEGGASRYALRYNSGLTDIGFRSRSDSVNTVTATGGTSTNFQVLMGRRNGTLQAVSINGGSEFSNNLALDETGIDGAKIGNLTDAAGFQLTGSIAEIILFSRSLSQDEISDVVNYLKTKWSI